jgi:death-on-curing family protein
MGIEEGQELTLIELADGIKLVKRNLEVERQMAAAYAFGLVKNHAFLDGNKRTAWGCCQLFLKINGAGVRAPADEAEENVVALATGAMSEAGFAGWLRGMARR